MFYPTFEKPAENELLGENLAYYTDEEDYVRFEDFKKRTRKTPLVSLALLFCMTAVTAYEYYKTQNPDVIGVLAAVIIVYFISLVYKKHNDSHKAVKKYMNKDPYYTSYKNARFFEDRAEFSAYDKNVENIVFEAIYPYSMMDAVIVTIEDYYFIIGNQAIIFPRRFAQVTGADKQLLDVFKESGKMLDQR